VIWGAYYLLWLYQRTFYGDVTVEANNNLSDLNARERLSLWPIAVMSLVMGVVPMIFLRQINPAVQAALSGVNGGVQAAAPTAHHFLQVLAQVIGR
jgi:NADH-quinone oxidoreductase subunit M